MRGGPLKYSFIYCVQTKMKGTPLKVERECEKWRVDQIFFFPNYLYIYIYII